MITGLYEFGSEGIDVQIAKESFMDRLKREREEASKQKVDATSSATFKHEMVSNCSSIFELKVPDCKRIPSDSFQSKTKVNGVKGDGNQKRATKRQQQVDVTPQVNGIRKDSKSMEADKKRLESISQMKREYRHQKSVIQAALSNIVST